MEGDYMIKGVAASSGIAIGKALVVEKRVIEIQSKKIDNIEEEKERFLKAVEVAKDQVNKLKNLTEKKLGKDKAAIFGAHIMMLDDPELIGAVKAQIENEKVNAEYALKATVICL
jgi:phosphotransferase system enzyme I (PtsI)